MEFQYDGGGRTTTINTLNALILTLKSKLKELRCSTNMVRHNELLADINLISEQIGPDVVQHVGLLVARNRAVVLSIYDGRGCSKSRLTISTQLNQLIRLRGVAPCPFCDELLVGNAIFRAEPPLAAGVAGPR